MKYKAIFTLITSHGVTMHTVEDFASREVADQVCKDWAKHVQESKAPAYLVHTMVMDYEE